MKSTPKIVVGFCITISSIWLMNSLTTISQKYPVPSLVVLFFTALGGLLLTLKGTDVL